MIVIDASALTALLLGGPEAEALQRCADYHDEWHAPEHLTIEVASALRGRWLGEKLDDQGFVSGLQRLAEAAVVTYPVRTLLPRLAELARNVTVYDAAYLALAETLAVPLLTLDGRLRRVPGVRCRFAT